MKRYISATIVLLAACSHVKEVSSESLKKVQTNGIYVAIDPFTSMISSPTTMAVIKNQKAIHVLRFLDQENGIMIPEALTDGEALDQEKILQLYNWTLEFENKNPNEKKFVHFILEPAKGDSIIIWQRDGKQFASFIGTNEQDSLLLNYDFGLDMPGRVAEEIKRPLVFKFYKVRE